MISQYNTSLSRKPLLTMKSKAFWESQYSELLSFLLFLFSYVRFVRNITLKHKANHYIALVSISSLPTYRLGCLCSNRVRQCAALEVTIGGQQPHLCFQQFQLDFFIIWMPLSPSLLLLLGSDPIKILLKLKKLIFSYTKAFHPRSLNFCIAVWWRSGVFLKRAWMRRTIQVQVFIS